MFGTGESLLQHFNDLLQLARRHRFGVKPESRELAAAQDSVGVVRQSFKLSLAKDEPIDRLVLSPPDEILVDAVAAIDIQLGV